MRLIRLFLIVLMSIALPFTNVAAAAMVHCGESTMTPGTIASAQPDDGGMHVHHHAAQKQDATDHHQHHSHGKADSGCNHCSYCQSCTSAFFPPVDSAVPSFEAADIRYSLVTDPVPVPFLEQPFRPPLFAFA